MVSKSIEWVKNNVFENKKELLEVAEQANRILVNRMSLDLVHPEVALAVYGTIFQSACKFISEKEADYDAYDLNIADFLHIGYTTTDSEDDEKNGNFMVYLQHVPNESIDAVIDEEETNTLALAALWNATHIKSQVEQIKDVAVQGMKDITGIINLKVQSHEFIIPMFSIIHAQLIKYLREKRSEFKQSEYELNVCGLFNAGCSINDDTEEEIYLTPSITLKLLFKNDSIASSSGDDD